jgi:hypothetical protein
MQPGCLAQPRLAHWHSAFLKPSGPQQDAKGKVFPSRFLAVQDQTFSPNSDSNFLVGSRAFTAQPKSHLHRGGQRDCFGQDGKGTMGTHMMHLSHALGLQMAPAVTDSQDLPPRQN